MRRLASLGRVRGDEDDRRRSQRPPPASCDVRGECPRFWDTHAARREGRALPTSWDVIEESHADKQSTLLVRTTDPVLDPAWTVRPVSLEDMVLAYMSQSADATRARRPGLEVAS